jgi:hypothetical protein
LGKAVGCVDLSDVFHAIKLAMAEFNPLNLPRLQFEI